MFGFRSSNNAKDNKDKDTRAGLFGGLFNSAASGRERRGVTDTEDDDVDPGPPFDWL